jgi:general secretion pathway protein F
MPEFLVRLHQPPQGVVLRRVQAADAQGVASALGVAPMQVLDVELQAAAGATAPARGTQRFPLRLFSQELAVLLDAGIPLLEALVTLREKESATAVAGALAVLIARLQQGESLSAALAQQPRCFDALFVAVVAASERSGQTAVALHEHARYLAWAETLRQRLLSAAIYPLLLLGVGGAVVLFLLLYVLPRFAGVLDGLGSDLPLASRWLIAFGRVAGEHPVAVFAAALALLALPLLAWRQPALRARCAALAQRAPVLGPRLRVLALARFYRTTGMLLGAGVPLLPTLRLVHGVVAAPWRTALQSAADAVADGARLSDALERHGLTTPVARRMLRVGERSGELAAMLTRAAAFHDEEIAGLTEFITKAVNPVLMLVMGVVIGGIVVLMYLPIFALVDQVQ